MVWAGEGGVGGSASFIGLARVGGVTSPVCMVVGVSIIGCSGMGVWACVAVWECPSLVGWLG